MARRSPSENYIKYLLVHPHNLTEDEVRKEVIEQGLDFIGMPYLDRLREEMSDLPQPFYPLNRVHTASQRFLIRHKLYSMFFPDHHVNLAKKLLLIPRAKEMIEQSFITGSGAAWIAAVVSRAGYRTSVKALEVYRHYFFNLDLVDNTELKALMMKRVASEPSDDPDEQILNMIRENKQSTRSDSRILASQSAGNPIGALLNKVQMGLMPTDVELQRLVSTTRLIAVTRCLGSMKEGSGYSAQAARDFASVAKGMHDIIETLGSPEEELQQSLYQLALKVDNDTIADLDQLEGSYTTNVNPQLENVSEEDLESVE